MPEQGFSDRSEAGRELAKRLEAMSLADPVVYALPRGGVPLAVEIARTLNAPIDVLLVRKIGAPGHAELALAAVVDGAAPQTVLNEEVREVTGASAAYLASARDRELKEIQRRRAAYLGERAPISPKGRTAIVVDDGLAPPAPPPRRPSAH